MIDLLSWINFAVQNLWSNIGKNIFPGSREIDYLLPRKRKSNFTGHKISTMENDQLIDSQYIK